MMMLFGAAMAAAAMAAINAAINRVMTQVLEPVTSMIGSPLDAIWRGDDADAFKKKVVQQLIRALTSITGYGNATVSGLERAMDLIKGADNQARGAVGELSNVFSQIF